MIATILAFAAGSSVAQAELVKVFDAVCLHQAPLEHIDANAAASGFHPVPVQPQTTENHETKAWQRGDVRLFTLSGQKDPRWLLQPFCGVMTSVGKQDNDQKLVRAVGNAAGGGFVEGRPAPGRSSFTLPREDGKGVVEVFVDRHDPKHVNVTLLLQMPPSVRPEK